MNKELLYFNKMIVPKMITFIFWAMLGMSVIYGIYDMFSGFEGLTFTSLIMGLVFMVIGAFISRVMCEGMIVIFKINENLQTIANNQEKESPEVVKENKVEELV